MNTRPIIWLGFIGTIATFVATTPAPGVITAVSTIPSGRNVPLGRSVSTSTIWEVSTSVGPFVTSPQGVFETALGAPLGVVNTTLTRPAAAGDTVRIPEAVRIPAAIMRQARQLGSSSFRYRRDFQDADGSGGLGSAFMTFFLTGSSGADFAISSLTLQFDDEQPVRLAPIGEALRAEVELTFSGTGFLSADWELATPASTLGEPHFFTQHSIRVYLTGSRTVTLTSPELPTDSSGQYLVRFRITQPPAADFENPVIRYQIQGEPVGAKERAPNATGRIRIGGPPDRAALSPETRFEWQPMEGARAYQLEFYRKDEASRNAFSQTPPMGSGGDPRRQAPGQPVTGMIVSAEKAEVVLSRISRDHLLPGKIYLWRVLAIGPGGGVLGESELREVTIPAEKTDSSPD